MPNITFFYGLDIIKIPEAYHMSIINSIGKLMCDSKHVRQDHIWWRRFTVEEHRIVSLLSVAEARDIP